VIGGVAAALSALAGIAVARPPARGYAAAPIIMAMSPFPSSIAGGQLPRPSATPGSGHRSSTPATTAPATPPVARTTAPVVISPSATPASPVVAVSYVVVSQWDDEFEGEITITSTSPSAITGWQIVVALPADRVTALSPDASGYVSNHILLVHPATYANAVPAHGTLSVFFTAYGTSTTPELCAFNNTACSQAR